MNLHYMREDIGQAINPDASASTKSSHDLKYSKQIEICGFGKTHNLYKMVHLEMYSAVPWL